MHHGSNSMNWNQGLETALLCVVLLVASCLPRYDYPVDGVGEAVDADVTTADTRDCQAEVMPSELPGLDVRDADELDPYVPDDGWGHEHDEFDIPDNLLDPDCEDCFAECWDCDVHEGDEHVAPDEIDPGCDGIVFEDGLCGCAPACDGKECGNDGCGGSCGECEDNDECTVDFCDEVAGCLHEDVVCDETGECLVHSCIPATGCDYAPDDSLCAEGFACHEDGVCLPDVVDMTAGSSHTCVILDGGSVWCWGRNEFGQLGTGDEEGSNVPKSVPGLEDATELAAGHGHTCALIEDKSVMCWGWDGSGQVGDNDEAGSNKSTPVNVEGVEGAAAVTAGEKYTCAIVASGGVKCWGNNEAGQLGNGEQKAKELVPVDVGEPSLSGVTAIAAGMGHTCAVLPGGAINCWGFNSHAQIGDGTTLDKNLPTQVDGITQGGALIAAGQRHTCALAAGALKCWGDSTAGKSGNGSTDSVVYADKVTGVPPQDDTVLSLSAGRYHTCARLDPGDAVWCWGSNFFGELGNGNDSGASNYQPTQIAELAAVGLTAGRFHNCAISSAADMDEPWCWGDNERGQLGDGTTAHKYVPTKVVGLSDVTLIEAGGSHTCAIVSGQEVYCWGDNFYGQLGLGTSGSKVPVEVTWE